jgi:hypothetical protein
MSVCSVEVMLLGLHYPPVSLSGFKAVHGEFTADEVPPGFPPMGPVLPKIGPLGTLAEYRVATDHPNGLAQATLQVNLLWIEPGSPMVTLTMSNDGKNQATCVVHSPEYPRAFDVSGPYDAHFVGVPPVTAKTDHARFMVHCRLSFISVTKWSIRYRG